MAHRRAGPRGRRAWTARGPSPAASEPGHPRRDGGPRAAARRLAGGRCPAGRNPATRNAAARHAAARHAALAALAGATLLAAGPGVSAVGVARSVRWRARPYLVASAWDTPPASRTQAQPLAAPTPAAPPDGRASLPRVVRQRGRRDCGPAALATALTWLGRPVDEARLLAAARLRADGASLAEVARLAAAFDLPGAWYAVPAAELGSLPTPFLAHLQGREGHYVAVARVLRGFVLFADPARGLVLERRARFERSWSRRVLLFRAAPEPRAATDPAERVPIETGDR